MVNLTAWKTGPRHSGWKPTEPKSGTKDEMESKLTDPDKVLSIDCSGDEQSAALGTNNCLMEDQASSSTYQTSAAEVSTGQIESDLELRAIFGPPPTGMVSFNSTPYPPLRDPEGKHNVYISKQQHLVPYSSSSDGTRSPPPKRSKPTTLSTTDRKLVQMKAEILAEVSLQIELFKGTVENSITTKLDQFKDTSDGHLEHYVTRRLEIMDEALDKQLSTFMAGFSSDTQSLESRVAALEIQPSLGLNFNDLLQDY